MSSVLTVNTKRSAKQFALGQRGGILTTSIPASASTASNDAANLAAPIAYQELETGSALAVLHQEVAACWVVQDPSGWPVTPRTCR